MNKMPKCLVAFCKNRRGESEGVNFYNLTVDRYEPWLKALGRDPIIDKVAIKNNVVCSEHFTEGSFFYLKNKKVLKRFATPTLKLKPERYASFHDGNLKHGMPLVVCCVPGCNNKLAKKVFFHMPVDILLKKLWMMAIFGVVDTRYKNSFICSAHFKEDDFTEDGRCATYSLPPKKILKQNAVPSVNLPRKQGHFMVGNTVIKKEHPMVHPMGILIYKYNKPVHTTSQEKIRERMEDRLNQRISILKADLKAEKDKCLILQRKMAELKNKASELDGVASGLIEEDLKASIHGMFSASSSKSRLEHILKSQKISKTGSSSSTSLPYTNL